MGINFNGMPKSAQGANFVKPQTTGLTDKSDTVGSPEEMQAGETFVNKDVDVLKVISQTHTQNADGTWSHGDRRGVEDGHYIDILKYADGHVEIYKYHFETDENGFISIVEDK